MYGIYKNVWNDSDLITAEKLNKMEKESKTHRILPHTLFRQQAKQHWAV